MYPSKQDMYRNSNLYPQETLTMHYWPSLLPQPNYGRNRANTPVDGVEDISMFRSNYLTIKDEDNTHSDTSSENSSVFDNERRGSIVSTTTSIEPVDYVTINNYKFYSQEYTFTTVEKQYISNCIPDLNFLINGMAS